MKRPVAYLRKSRVTSDRHVSWTVQETEIRALAARHGDDEVEVLADWGKSGRGERTRFRPDYLELRRRIEADEVSVLYAYSLSRLSRSLGEYASLAELCRDHGVRVRLSKEGEFDYTTVSGRFNVGVLALLAQMEAELAQERAKDTIAVRSARGDHVGSAGYGQKLVGGRLEDHPGEDVSKIVAAFAEAGSFAGAAKLLNERNVPTKTGSAKWAQTSVARVLRRAGQAPASRPDQRGVRMRGNFTLSRLLVCPCGNVLTGRKTSHTTKYGSYGPYVSYQCFRGRYEPGHVRPYMISEAVILPWIMAEAARFDPRREGGIAQLAEADAGALVALEAKRARIVDAFIDGTIDKQGRDVRLATVDAEITALETRQELVTIPAGIDWTWQPKELNAVLTTYWSAIQLGPDMKPVRAEWRLPDEWLS